MSFAATKNNNYFSPRYYLTATLFLIVLFLFGHLPICSASGEPPAVWGSLGSALPTAREYSASIVVGKQIYIIGGMTNANTLEATDKVETLDTVTGSWETKAPMPTARWGATAASIDGKLFIVSAGSPVPGGSANVEEYDPDTDSWSQEATIPQTGWGAASAAVNGKVYVFGGFNWSSGGIAANRQYDPQTDAWTWKAPMPTSRRWLGAQAINDEIYVVGGWDQSDTYDLPTLEVYDPQSDTWATKAPLPVGLRSFATAAVNNRLYVIGGISGNPYAAKISDAVFSYDPDHDSWTELSQKLPVPIAGAAAQTIDGAIYLFGGESDSGILDTVYVLKKETSKRNPVVLIPGIFGSQEISGKWVLDPILHSYDNLIEALKLAGYQENTTLFTFPYDWRQSNASSSILLKQKIDEAKVSCSEANPAGYDCSKVDLVAHSMGGLVARAYAESDKYQNDIDQLIFLATPQQGSPIAYLGWEGGTLGRGLINRFIVGVLGLQAASYKYNSVFDYVRNFPIQSVEELLPTYDYLQDKDSTGYRVYPNNYPINTFLQNLNAQFNLNKLNDIIITNILADDGNNDTIGGLRLVSQSFSNSKWANGYPEGYDSGDGDHGLIMGDGDNTVPKASNSNFFGQQDLVIDNSSHMFIPTDAQKEVIKDLTGVEPTIKVNYYPAIEAMKNFLIFAIFSPADFVVTAPDGQQLGKDFLNNAVINQIPNAYYSGFTDDPEFVVIPNPIDGQYKVQLQGKSGGGNYHVQASYINDSTTTVKDFPANIAQDQNQIFNLNCASNSPQSIINLAPQDTIPPTIIINTPTSSTQYFHSDKLKINYTANDDFSGIASVAVAIDGNILNTTTIDLFNYPLGAHKVSIKAIDKSGNQSIKMANFEITANIDSSIFDINTVYAKKWLSKEADKNTLILNLGALKLGLDLLAIEKTALDKLISDTQNNQKLSAAAKKKIIDPLNQLLTVNSNARQLLIKNSLGDMQKNLDKIKAKNGINQPGYDIIKADINYLLSN